MNLAVNLSDRPPSFQESQAAHGANGTTDGVAGSSSSGPPPPAVPGLHPAVGSSASSVRSGNSVARRNWDDPPEHEPVAPPDTETTMILVASYQLRGAATRLGCDVKQVAFSPSDTFVVATTHQLAEDWSSVAAWRASNRLQMTFPGPHVMMVEGHLALAPTAEYTIAFAATAPEAGFGRSPVPRERLETWDMAPAPKRRMPRSLPLRAPLAWSPDGELLAGASAREPSRIYVVRPKTGALAGAIPHHVGAVTHLAFTPDGAGLVSLSRDGSCKVTNLASGRVQCKFEVETRHDPLLLRVSADGETVASVWGRDVMLWSPMTGTMKAYNLSDVRQTEGVALDISHDCKYLVCRSEDGFDVLDLATGKFRAEVTADRSFVTAAAFSYDGKSLAVGKHNSELIVYQIVVAEPKSSA